MKSFCDYYNEGRCGSCEWIELAYPEQLRKKEAVTREALDFLAPFNLEESVASPLREFRNRAKMVVTGGVESPVIGLIGSESLDQGRELLSCPIHHPKLNELIRALPGFIQRFNLVPYRIAEKKGELKALILFYSGGTDQMYLRFVLRSKECVSRIKKLIPVLQRDFPALVCVSANLQPIPHAILEGPEEIILTDLASIRHEIGPLALELVPQAFVQTNSRIAAALYECAARWVGEARALRTLELFSGQGAFSLYAAKNAGQLLGIEIHPAAVRTANQAAQEMGLLNVSFKNADASRVGDEIAQFRPDLILANPPRRGLGESLGLIAEALPKHILYSSCSMESLASDLRQLSTRYRLKRVRLFDMFPHTRHFETLVLLESYTSQTTVFKG